MRALEDHQRLPAGSEIFELRVPDGDMRAQRPVRLNAAVQDKRDVRRGQFAVSLCNHRSKIEFLHEVVEPSQILNGEKLGHIHTCPLQHIHKEG